MRTQYVAIALFVTCLGQGCARNEPSLVPLGHGPLSLEERTLDRDDADARRTMHRADRLEALPKAEPELEARESTVVVALHSDDKKDSSDAVDAGAAVTISDPSKSDGTLEDWLGLYRGDDTTTFKMPEQPDRKFDDPKARIRIERLSKRQVSLALIDSSNDKDICKLTGTVDGDTATIEPGQSCFLDPEENMTVKSRPGKAARKSKQLTLDLVLDTRMDTEIGAIDGSIVYHFTGQR